MDQKIIHYKLIYVFHENEEKNEDSSINQYKITTTKMITILIRATNHQYGHQIIVGINKMFFIIPLYVQCELAQTNNNDNVKQSGYIVTNTPNVTDKQQKHK
eukprot:535940_1